MQMISSQRYIDDEIVQAKIDAGDFDVLVSPEFEFDGQTFCVVLDGHHSLTAAKEAGVEPTLMTASTQEFDGVDYLANGNIQDFLEVAHMGDDYYSVETGKDIW